MMSSDVTLSATGILFTMTTPTIPALRASESLWRRWRNKKSSKPLPTKTKVVIGIIAAWIIATIVLSTLHLAAAQAVWKGRAEGVPAVAIEDSRYTSDLGQVTKVTYEYDGVERTAMASASGATIAGDEVEIAVLRESGEPAHATPYSVGLCLALGLIQGGIVGLLVILACVITAGVRGAL